MRQCCSCHYCLVPTISCNNHSQLHTAAVIIGNALIVASASLILLGSLPCYAAIGSEMTVYVWALISAILLSNLDFLASFQLLQLQFWVSALICSWTIIAKPCCMYRFLFSSFAINKTSLKKNFVWCSSENLSHERCFQTLADAVWLHVQESILSCTKTNPQSTWDSNPITFYLVLLIKLNISTAT